MFTMKHKDHNVAIQIMQCGKGCLTSLSQSVMSYLLADKEGKFEFTSHFNTISAVRHPCGHGIGTAPTQSDYTILIDKSWQWKQVKQVTMPERPYLEPAITDNINKIEDIIKAEILTQMNKP